MTDTPPDWVLIEAAKRSGWKGEDELTLRNAYFNIFDDAGFTALCDMIWKYEKPPVDRKLLCAREAYRNWFELRHKEGLSMNDYIAIRAIELWEEGFGRD